MEQIAEFAQTHHVPIMSDATWAWLQPLLDKIQPKHCLEVGSAIGRGSIHIAKQIQSWGGHLISFEISHPSYQLALWHQRQDRLHNLRCYHADFLRVPTSFLGRLDFLFIDGQKSSYADFLMHVQDCVQEQTVIVCDDVVRFGDKMTGLHEAASALGFHTALIPLADGDGVLVLTKDMQLLSDLL